MDLFYKGRLQYIKQENSTLPVGDVFRCGIFGEVLVLVLLLVTGGKQSQLLVLSLSLKFDKII